MCVVLPFPSGLCRLVQPDTVVTIAAPKPPGYGSFGHSHSIQETEGEHMNGGEWVSGYHSDSAIQRSPARIRSARSKGSLRDMLDPA